MEGMNMNGVMWRKSSRCDSNLCVEVGAADWTRATRCDDDQCLEVKADWQKSSRSLANGDCVEARRPNEVEVYVRDSTDKDGPVLTVTAADWKAFLADLPAA